MSPEFVFHLLNSRDLILIPSNVRTPLRDQRAFSTLCYIYPTELLFHRVTNYSSDLLVYARRRTPELPVYIKTSGGMKYEY